MRCAECQVLSFDLTGERKKGSNDAWGCTYARQNAPPLGSPQIEKPRGARLREKPVARAKCFHVYFSDTRLHCGEGCLYVQRCRATPNSASSRSFQALPGDFPIGYSISSMRKLVRPAFQFLAVLICLASGSSGETCPRSQGGNFVSYM